MTTDRLAEFLGRSKPQAPANGRVVGGTFACQECNDVMSEAYLNYDDKTLTWVCNNHHKSQVSINV